MLGERLMKLRKAQKWTQTELAERCKVSRNSIVNWETNKREPKIGDIMRLAEVLNVSPHELIASEDANVLQDTPQEPINYAYWGGDYIQILNWLEMIHFTRPIKIHIHSMNPVGIQNMKAIIKRNHWEEI